MRHQLSLLHRVVLAQFCEHCFLCKDSLKQELKARHDLPFENLSAHFVNPCFLAVADLRLAILRDDSKLDLI